MIGRQIRFCARPCEGTWSSRVSFVRRMRFPGGGFVAGGGPRGLGAGLLLCWWRGRWAGGFCDVLEARPGALVGLLVARGWPACPGARRLVRQVGGSRRRAPRSRGGRRRCTRVTRRSGGWCPWVCGVWSGRVNPYAAGRPAAGERLDGLLRASGPIGARQDPPAGSGAGPGLVQCPADDLDVVGARAASRKRRGAARVPRASSPALPVPWSNHAVRGAVTEPLLEGSGPYPLFLRVDAHQSGVDVDHRWPVRPDTGGRSAQTPVAGECSPAGAHARCLAVLRARPRRPRRGRSGFPPVVRPWGRRQRTRGSPSRTAARGPTGNGLPGPRAPPDPP